MNNFKKKYQGRTNLLLFNAIAYFLLGITFFFSEFFVNYLAFIWWGGSLLWAYRYRSLSKKGYIKIFENQISINHANWKGVEDIEFDIIEAIIEKPNSYILKLNGEKSSRIFTQIISKNNRDIFKEDIREIEEKIKLLHNKG